MPTSRKKRQRSEQFPVSRRRTRKKPGRQEKTRKREEKSIGQFAAGWFSQHPVFVFLLVFGALMGLFYAISLFTPLCRRHLLPPYLRLVAKVSGAILAVLSQDITVAGDSIFSPRFSVSIKTGCSAIEPTALFMCAVLAFPAPFLKKIPGIIAGTLFLAILNLIRVVSLFLVGVYFPKAFHFTHIDMWQALFIFFAILFWIFWLRWVTQSQIPRQRVSS